MAIRRYNIPINQDISTRYACDLNDQEFGLLASQVAQKDGSGKRRTVDIREVLNAIFYRIITGCQWRMLPSDFPAWYHVWYYYRKWRNDGTLERINGVYGLLYVIMDAFSRAADQSAHPARVGRDHSGGAIYDAL